MNEDRFHDDPYEQSDMCEELYVKGYCYDCGELNCVEKH